MRSLRLLASAAIAALAACSTAALDEELDAGPPAGELDADSYGRLDGGSNPKPGEAGSKDDAGPADVAPPARIEDLSGEAATHTSIALSFTAVGDDGMSGSAAAYEIRWSMAPIAGEAEFLAATAASSPVPLPPGTAEEIVVGGLEPETAYHVRVRARDAAGNVGALSDELVVTTKARAKLLVSEIAPANDAGARFVELVAATGGWAGDLVVYQALKASTPVYELAGLDVAAGDRIVVHVTGLPGPAGFAQEDVTKDKTSSTAERASEGAYDVYSTHTSIVATDNVVSVRDGNVTMDAVAFSNRSGDPAAAAMTAFAQALSDGAWAFTSAPVLGTTDCETELEAVNASGSSSPACGGAPGLLSAGYSIQRNGVVDTDTKADFSVEPETPGAANAFCPDLGGAELALAEVNPRAGLVELLVTRGGSLRSYSLRSNPTPDSPSGTHFVTFPAICAAEGDLVVVHLAAGAGAPSETAAKDEHPQADDPSFYDGAWDVSATNATNLPYATSLVLAVRDPAKTYLEAAAFSSMTTAASTTYNEALAYVQGLGLWLPADCGGAACTNDTIPTGRALAASWNGVDTTASGSSCRRSDPAATAASWSVGASSFGAAN